MIRSRAAAWLVPLALLVTACGKPAPQPPAASAYRTPQAELDAAARLEATARAMLEAGDVQAAVQNMTRVMAIRRRLLGEAHSDTWSAAELLTMAHLQKHDTAKAEATARWELSLREKALGSASPQLLGPLARLAEALEYRGEHASAEQARRRALSIAEAAQPPRPADVAEAAVQLGNTLVTMCRPADAEPLFRRALQLHESAEGAASPASAAAWRGLADVQWLAKDDAAAQASLEKALALLTPHESARPKEVMGALDQLALMMATRGLAAEERRARERAADLGIRSLPVFGPATMTAIGHLWDSLRAANDAAARQALLARTGLTYVERLRPGRAPAPIFVRQAPRECAPRETLPGSVPNAAAVVASFGPGFGRCYNRLLRKDPNVAGEIKAVARIEASGEVSRVHAFVPVGPLVPLAECVLDTIVVGRFSPPTKAPVGLNLPVRFRSE